jgi:glycosyltransferase involved in cell wall biosynthesis
MNLVLFAHPEFLKHQSMPRYAGMIAKGMLDRGHNVSIWSPRARLYKLPVGATLKKWLGYIDQYIIFPMEVRRRMKNLGDDTLFIFADNALGPWVALACDRPHLIHCHDFLAQRSALGEIPENPLGFTGRLYQKYIRQGYSKGKYFLSGSENTRKELEQLLLSKPSTSLVIYNGLNQTFTVNDTMAARASLGKKLSINLDAGFLLHVGGNMYYKNRIGVIEIYNAWRKQFQQNLPLLLIGETPSDNLKEVYQDSPFKQDIYLLPGLDDQSVRTAYCGATVFLFPSLAEGFGWPIAEAMASGCPVITTNEAPMTEVAGAAGFLIPRRPFENTQAVDWAQEAAKTVNRVVTLSSEERRATVEAGFLNAKRFDPKIALDKIEAVYKTILNTSR